MGIDSKEFVLTMGLVQLDVAIAFKQMHLDLAGMLSEKNADRISAAFFELKQLEANREYIARLAC